MYYDEEHVLFHCPEYDICRQEYPELFLGTNMNLVPLRGWGEEVHSPRA